MEGGTIRLEVVIEGDTAEDIVNLAKANRVEPEVVITHMVRLYNELLLVAENEGIIRVPKKKLKYYY